jgi:hypothetical protein
MHKKGSRTDFTLRVPYIIYNNINNMSLFQKMKKEKKRKEKRDFIRTNDCIKIDRFFEITSLPIKNNSLLIFDFQPSNYRQ